MFRSWKLPAEQVAANAHHPLPRSTFDKPDLTTCYRNQLPTRSERLTEGSG